MIWTVFPKAEPDADGYLSPFEMPQDFATRKEAETWQKEELEPRGIQSEIDWNDGEIV